AAVIDQGVVQAAIAGARIERDIGKSVMLDQIDDDVGLPRLLGVADGRVGFGDVVHRSGPCGNEIAAGPYEARRTAATPFTAAPRAIPSPGRGRAPSGNIRA